MAPTSMMAEADEHRGHRFSVWTFVAPVALLAAVTIIVSVVRGAHWLNKPVARTTAPVTTPVAKLAKHHKAHKGVVVTKKYTVHTGDTLTSIALRFGTSVARLKKLNPGVVELSLRPGEIIRLPSS